MKVLTFGEVLLRLKAPGNERLFQSAALEATFGGSEANVAVSLANYGVASALVSVFPQENPIADACLRELRGFGVDVSQVRRAPGRMGAYYLENGVGQRSARVVYDRAYSAMSLAKSGDIDWNQVLQGVNWFHFSGITPAISASARDLTLEGLQEAKRRGITISCDLNYRSRLWKYGERAADVMPKLVQFAEVVIAAEDDIPMALGITSQETDGVRRTEELCQKTLEAYPDLHSLGVILHESHGAERRSWQAFFADRTACLHSRTYEIEHIIDCVGGGDAFAGGLIFGLNYYPRRQTALEFATAASMLKYGVIGDYHRVTRQEVEQCMVGDRSALQR